MEDVQHNWASGNALMSTVNVPFQSLGLSSFRPDLKSVPVAPNRHACDEENHPA